MSSKPSPAGVSKTIEMLDRLAALDHEIRELVPKAKRLDDARVDREQLARQLGEHLRSMDVDSPGNWGWPGRFGWFAAELLRQARAGSPGPADGEP